MHARYLLLWTALFSVMAGAAEKSPVSKPLADITKCRSVEASALRLACYDKAAALLVDAYEKGVIVIADKSEVQRARRSLFGLPIPNVPLLGGERARQQNSEADIRELATTIVSTSPFGYGTWAIAVAEGGRWHTTEADRTLTPRAGDKIIIRRGPLGGYIATIAGQRGIKVRRVD